jgi:hypothetical protein
MSDPPGVASQFFRRKRVKKVPHRPKFLSHWYPTRQGIAAALLAFGITAGTSREAQALTIVLDFVIGATTDVFGVGTTTANLAAYGFTGLTDTQVRTATLAAVTNDYLGFPTVGMNPLSPLANGKRLGIDFELGFNNFTAPTNGDSEYYYFAIGSATGGHTFLGQACLGCVRVPFETGPNFGAVNGMTVGSILTNNIAALAVLATTDAQRVNLLAGTISHEIGHSLFLLHSGVAANPGASTYTIMGTGAEGMPNGERILDRSFSYSEFDQLIDAVGVVPEPGTWLLLSTGLVVGLFARARQRQRGA